MAEWIPRSGLTYWQYLQQRSFVSDLATAHREAAQETVRGIERATKDLLLGQAEGSATIVQAVEDSGRKIAALGSEFRWGFGEVLGALGGMTDSLQALIEIARSPAQTAAYEHFEVARDAFRRRLYQECLEELSKAIFGDSTSPGYKLEWRFHHLAGVVRLGFDGCDLTLVDTDQATRDFLLAARYARADSPADAARALLLASRAAFAQDDLSSSAEHARAALALSPELAEAHFQVALLDVLRADFAAAMVSLRRAATQDAGYLVRAAGHAAFQGHSSGLTQFVAEFRADVVRQLAAMARGALGERVQWDPPSDVLAGHPALQRWTALARGDTGESLVELTRYLRAGFREDVRSVRDAETRERNRRTAEAELQRTREEKARQEILDQLRRQYSDRLEKLLSLSSYIDAKRSDARDLIPRALSGVASCPAQQDAVAEMTTLLGYAERKSAEHEQMLTVARANSQSHHPAEELSAYVDALENVRATIPSGLFVSRAKKDAHIAALETQRELGVKMFRHPHDEIFMTRNKVDAGKIADQISFWKQQLEMRRQLDALRASERLAVDALRSWCEAKASAIEP